MKKLGWHLTILIIFQINLFVIKMSENGEKILKFSKAFKMLILSGKHFKPKDIQLDFENQQIPTFEKSWRVNLWHFLHNSSHSSGSDSVSQPGVQGPPGALKGVPAGPKKKLEIVYYIV